jgi:hypothetical protein
MSGESDPLVLAGVLRSLGQIGDEPALRVVERALAHAEGPARPQGEFARTLIAHRLGLPHRSYVPVVQSKNGQQRTVPMNATVRSVFLDASLGRKTTHTPDERVFPMSYRTVARNFERAVRHARQPSGTLRRTLACWRATRGTAIATHSLVAS